MKWTLTFFHESQVKKTLLLDLEGSLSEIQLPRHFLGARTTHNNLTGWLYRNRYFWKRRDTLVPNKGLWMGFLHSRGWRAVFMCLWFQQDGLPVALALENHSQLPPASTLHPSLTWGNILTKQQPGEKYLLVVPSSCLFTSWNILADVVCWTASLRANLLSGFYDLVITLYLGSKRNYFCIHLTSTSWAPPVCFARRYHGGSHSELTGPALIGLTVSWKR